MANADEAKSQHRRELLPADALHESDPIVVLPIGPDTSWDSHIREQFEAVLDRSDQGIVICDVASIRHPNLGTLDVLARLQLGARLRGWRLTLHGAHPELRALLALAGLTRVLPTAPNPVCDPGQVPTEDC